jgi:hypothetical protein
LTSRLIGRIETWVRLQIVALKSEIAGIWRRTWTRVAYGSSCPTPRRAQEPNGGTAVLRTCEQLFNAQSQSVDEWFGDLSHLVFVGSYALSKYEGSP